MGKYSGRRIGIGIAKESSRGTKAGTPEYWLPYATFNGMETLAKVRDDSGFATIETPADADIVRQWMEGDLEMNIRSKSIGLLLLSLFGTETFDDDNPEAGVGQHTFTVANTNQHQSLTLFEDNPEREVAAAGVVVTSMGLELVLDQYARASFGLMGKTFEDYASTASFVAESKFRPQDVTVKLAADVASLTAASALTSVESVSLEINKNVEVQDGFNGSTDPIDFLNLDFEVSGEITLMHNGDTELDYALNNTLRAMRIDIENTDDTIGAASNPSLRFDLSQVDFDEPSIDKGLSNRAILTLSFTAHYKLSETDMIEARLINAVNTAY